MANKDKVDPQKPNRWYNAAKRVGGVPLCPGCRHYYVKKSWNEGQVLVWDGRFYITHISIEDARKSLELFDALDAKEQERLDQEFSWYLNY